MSDFEEAIPILNVRNIQASMDYYVQKLGFEKKWDWGGLGNSFVPFVPLCGIWLRQAGVNIAPYIATCPTLLKR